MAEQVLPDPIIDVILGPYDSIHSQDLASQWNFAAALLTFGAQLTGTVANADSSNLENWPFFFEGVPEAREVIRHETAIEQLSALGFDSVGEAIGATTFEQPVRGIFGNQLADLTPLLDAGLNGDPRALAGLLRACVVHDSEPIRVAASVIWHLSNPDDLPSAIALFQAINSVSKTADAQARDAVGMNAFAPLVVRPPDTPEILSSDAAHEDGKRSLIVHGTWAYDQTWWRPVEDTFHRYIKSAVRENLWDHPCAYYWSGRYDQGDRDVAVSDLIAWTNEHSQQGLDVLFAHSYGGHVALHAVAKGLPVNNLVLLSVPFFKDDKNAIEIAKEACDIFSFRTECDMVLFTNRVIRGVMGRLRYPFKGGPKPIDPGLPEHRLPNSKYVGHSLTHSSERWKDENLARVANLPAVEP